MSNNKLTKKEKFDTVIKKNLISLGISENAFTYSITQKDEKISEYSLYFNKAEFDAFVKEMETLYLKHLLKYRDGAGSELVEKNGRYGLTPP
ncbi:MAG: hypothetical protein IJD88_07910, partial [Clostridia bacterium]|nr:hypothetical protein [Clostridia bacterium]